MHELKNGRVLGLRKRERPPSRWLAVNKNVSSPPNKQPRKNDGSVEGVVGFTEWGTFVLKNTTSTSGSIVTWRVCPSPLIVFHWSRKVYQKRSMNRSTGMILLPCRKSLTTQRVDVHLRINEPTVEKATNWYNSLQSWIWLFLAWPLFAILSVEKAAVHHTKLFNPLKTRVTPLVTRFPYILCELQSAILAVVSLSHFDVLWWLLCLHDTRKYTGWIISGRISNHAWKDNGWRPDKVDSWTPVRGWFELAAQSEKRVEE